MKLGSEGSYVIYLPYEELHLIGSLALQATVPNNDHLFICCQLLNLCCYLKLHTVGLLCQFPLQPKIAPYCEST